MDWLIILVLYIQQDSLRSMGINQVEGEARGRDSLIADINHSIGCSGGLVSWEGRERGGGCSNWVWNVFSDVPIRKAHSIEGELL